MSKQKQLIPQLRFPEFKNEAEWGKKTVGEFAPLQRGFDLPIDTITQGKYPVVFSNGILKYHNEYKVKAPGIVTGRSGTIGKVTFVIEDFWPHNTSLWVTKFYENDPLFVYYYLLFIGLEQFGTGSGVPTLNRNDVHRYRIAVPKSKEQQKIASCLSSLDEVITAHSQKLELLKEHKKGLMQNLFPQGGEKVPKYRFREFQGKGNWVITAIENNCSVKGRIGYRGYTTEDLVSKGQGALVLGGKHIQNHTLDLSEPTFLSWEKYYESPEIMINVGDIIFSQRGTLGDCAIVDKKIGPATINPSMVLLKNIICNAKFLYYILIGDNIQKEVQKNRTSSAVPMLSQKQIKEFPFYIPSPKEQQKIASCLSALDELITAQANKIEQLKLHKKGLMQGLFPQLKD